MTLCDWLNQTGHGELLARDGSLVAVHDLHSMHAERADLWHLSDFRVSHVMAGVVWLAPRALDQAKQAEGVV